MLPERPATDTHVGDEKWSPYRGHRSCVWKDGTNAGLLKPEGGVTAAEAAS
jgi:hypothetical protein